MTDNLSAIDALSYEQRKFPPPSSFVADALTNDNKLYDEADRDGELFWAHQARELLEWPTPFTQICEWDPPYAEWFADGRLNVPQPGGGMFVIDVVGNLLGIELQLGDVGHAGIRKARHRHPFA